MHVEPRLHDSDDDNRERGEPLAAGYVRDPPLGLLVVDGQRGGRGEPHP